MFHFSYKLLCLFFCFGLSKFNQIFLKSLFKCLNTEKKEMSVNIFPEFYLLPHMSVLKLFTQIFAGSVYQLKNMLKIFFCTVIWVRNIEVFFRIHRIQE